MDHVRLNTTHPPDHVQAFYAEAERRGISVSELLGNGGLRMLPKAVRATLSERTPRGRKPQEAK